MINKYVKMKAHTDTHSKKKHLKKLPMPFQIHTTCKKQQKKKSFVK